MDITVTITEAEQQRVCNALCVASGLPAADSESPKNAIVGWVKATVENVNRSEAAREGKEAEVKPVEGVS